jgi:hypothetical protein
LQPAPDNPHGIGFGLTQGPAFIPHFESTFAMAVSVTITGSRMLNA